MVPTLPSFNITCNVWNDVIPGVDPPSYTVPCQLYYPRPDMTEGFVDSGNNILQEYVPPMFLRLPIGTDIKLPSVPAAGPIVSRSYVEVPAGSLRFYRVLEFDDAHKGFPNEYRVALIRKAFTQTLWPDPVP